MSVIIRDGKFHQDDWMASGGSFHDFDAMPLRPHDFELDHLGIDVPNSIDPNSLSGFVGEVSAIRIPFPSFADGRGFSIARVVRRMGFTGLLRAHGHIICEQYPLAVRAGFDEIEISDELARRQSEALWADALARINVTYLERLQAGMASAAA
ncbi:MAG: DUF934 domain-containing protein [Nitratireductor sp.]|nr:DUF934 domain-containing protein [Nitratireductor sp.]